MVDSIIININFTNLFIKEHANELFLFYKLRVFAAKYAGSYAGFEFTKNERYNVLPKLETLGWIKDGRVVKYRELLKVNNCASSSYRIDAYELESIVLFKSLMLSLCETYIIHVKHNKNKMRYKSESNKQVKVDQHWGKLSMAAKLQLQTEKKKIEGSLTEGIAGRAYNAEIVRLTGLSVATITRWRREAEGAGFNKYELKTIDVNGKHDRNTQIMVDDRVKKGSVFSADRNKKASSFTRDLTITTTTDMFSVRGRGKQKRLTERQKEKISLCGF